MEEIEVSDEELQMDRVEKRIEESEEVSEANVRIFSRCCAGCLEIQGHCRRLTTLSSKLVHREEPIKW